MKDQIITVLTLLGIAIGMPLFIALVALAASSPLILIVWLLIKAFT